MQIFPKAMRGEKLRRLGRALKHLLGSKDKQSFYLVSVRD